MDSKPHGLLERLARHELLFLAQLFHLKAGEQLFRNALNPLGGDHSFFQQGYYGAVHAQRRNRSHRKVQIRCFSRAQHTEPLFNMQNICRGLGRPRGSGL